MKRVSIFAVIALCLGVVMVMAQSGEFVDTEVGKYGYAFKLPKEFSLQDKIDKTTSWMYQPGAEPAGGGSPLSGLKPKLPGIGGIGGGGDEGGGGKESALTIYVNWVWMPDVSASTLYNTNKKSEMDNINSPDPDYTDLQVLDIDGGSAYWYKEVDKDDPDEIHRWHVKMFGNKSMYTVGLCGTYKQFEKWASTYEEVVMSFKLIPMEE